MGADAPMPPIMMLAAEVEDSLMRIFFTPFGRPRRSKSKAEAFKELRSSHFSSLATFEILQPILADATIVSPQRPQLPVIPGAWRVCLPLPISDGIRQEYC